MSDRLPLLAGTPDEFEALLLRSAEDDEPAAGALERTATALGLGASALVVGSASGAVAGHAAVGGSTALAKHLTLVSLVKWLAVGVAAGFVTGGAAHLATREPAAVQQGSAAAVVAVAPGERAVVQRGARPAPLPAEVAVATPTPEAEPAPMLAAPAAKEPAALPTPASTALGTPALGPSSASFAPLDEGTARSAPAPSTKAITPASQLGEETKALDGVRADLARGHTSQALGGLERYRAAFPHGALAAEATLLCVDALLRSGQRADARREANALIHAAPESRYASRARALLGE